ncbi:hypothetical protein [Tateyamaria sp.]|uniref:hypothetical protein n=1 Tax=Tateyamaria sp. TaxID=1929288 RepID=UPI00329D29EA
MIAKPSSLIRHIGFLLHAALAHLVLMPFTGFLDTENGFAKATSQLLAFTTMKTLPVWTPVLESALPDDEHLLLFFEASNQLLTEMSTTDYYLMYRLPDRLFSFGIEAT